MGIHMMTPLYKRVTRQKVTATLYSWEEASLEHDQRNSAWATLVAGAGTGVSYAGTNRTGHTMQAEIAGNLWRWIGRSILTFDISSLPSGLEVVEAIVRLYGTAKFNSVGGDPDINLYEAWPLNLGIGGIVAADYARIGAIPLSVPIAYAAWVLGAHNYFTLNALGRLLIQQGVAGDGFVKYGTRNASYDVANTPPPWIGMGSYYIYYYAGGSGPVFSPRLEVTYLI